MAAQLKYSELTDKIYFTDRGKKIEIDDNNFIQMILLWMYKDLPKQAKSIKREISVGGVTKFVISLKKTV
jgi:hypothetical protein